MFPLKVLMILLYVAMGISASPPHLAHHHAPVSEYDSTLQRREPLPLPIPAIPQKLGSAGGAVICRPEGLCERCPPSSIKEPFCQPYGNRRLIKCLPRTLENERMMEQAMKEQKLTKKPPNLSGETPAWEACGRVVSVERADFWEFLACVVMFAAASFAIIILRSKKLAALQYRKLAARIGLSPSSSL